MATIHPLLPLSLTVSLLGGCAMLPAPTETLLAARRATLGRFAVSRYVPGKPGVPQASPSGEVPASADPTPQASAPVEAETPVPSTAPVGGVGGGGGGGGGGLSDPPLSDGTDFPVTLLPRAEDLIPDETGWARLLLPPGIFGAVLVDQPGFVPGTIVLPEGNTITALNLRPAVGPQGPQGVVTITGNAGAANAGLLLRYVGPSLTELRREVIAEDGSFTLEVPVTATEAGMLVVSGRSVESPLGLRRVSVTAGETLTVSEIPVVQPNGVLTAPNPPDGLVATNGSLLLQVGEGTGASKLDVLGFPLPAVPTYDISGFDTGSFRLAAGFGAQSSDGLAGSRLLTLGSGTPSFLPAPELAAIPELLRPGLLISWNNVGASLYTVRLLKADQPFPVWEGATASSRLPLPKTLPRDLTDLSLEVMAWSAADVTLYSVAQVPQPRHLRIPSDTAAPMGRVSWRLKRGLRT